jgi:hypothetical protein
MRFNDTGFTAHFNATKHRPDGRTLDVIAWHPVTGDALVVDSKEGKLRAANSYSNFSHLEETDTIVGVLPGGWRLGWADANGGETTEPIPGWFLIRTGLAHPITVREEGCYGEDLDTHPGGRFIDPEAPTREGVVTVNGVVQQPATTT